MPIKTKLTLGLIIILLALSSQVKPAIRVANLDLHVNDPSYEREIEKWRKDRLEEINGENGWNTLLGLFWLHDGKNKVGSDPSNEIVLPPDRAPTFAGSIWLKGNTIRLDADPKALITHAGKPVHKLRLRSDANGEATVLRLGSLSMFMIKRGEKLGLRVKDKNHPTRSNFHGLDYFPLDTNWRVEATLEPQVPPKVIPIANVLGMIDNMTSPGTLVFELNGKTLRFDPVLEKGTKQFFVIFGDTTNGKETYGAGRYVYVDPPGKDGKVIIDFNKAYNPPCAFTKFATCPLPPRQNRLAIRVEAGEKKYAGSVH